MKKERICPNCKRESEDPNETICTACGYRTYPAPPPKKRTSFKEKAVTKDSTDAGSEPSED